MKTINFLNRDINKLDENTKKLIGELNESIKDKIIDELIEYESDILINTLKKDKELFKDKLYILLNNGVKGYKNTPIKILINIYIEKLGERKFINLIESIS